MHHFKTNNQTKSTNKIIKNYLPAYVSYTQDNWMDNLLLAKFAANNYINISTWITLFFTNYGFYLCIGIEPLKTYKRAKKSRIVYH